MSLPKILLFAIAAWVAWRVWSTWQRQQDRLNSRRDPDSFEPMVRCRQCGVHLPRSAASPAGLCGKCAS